MIKYFEIVLLSLVFISLHAQERMREPQAMIVHNDSIVFTSVEVLPSFKGGLEFMSAYIQQKIQEQEDVNAKCIFRITGTVYLKFIVEINGTLSHMKLLKGISNCTACNELALKIVREMPAWIPAYYQDKPVRSSYAVPVKFRAY